MGKHKRKRDSYDESESDRSRSRKARSDHNERNPKHSKKSKRKRSKSFKRDSSTESSASSASSTNSMKLLKRLQVERERILIERKKQKESLKASETPEEKRLRRLLKKELKERKRKERMGWDNDYLTYTNTDNPFGDSNLLETFVWKKKLEKLGLDSVSEEELARCTRQKQEENKRELEKVKKRRQEREAERASREDELALLQRQKEAAQFREWEKQEDYFHLQQARMRSQIRIQDGRAKPIDLLAKYISAEEEVDSIEMHEPYTCLAGLDMSDLEDLLEDIRVYKELEKGRNLSFWNDITIIVEDEVAKVRRIEASSREDSIGGRREGIHSAVTTDVSSIFKGKTHEQLLDLQNSISEKINNHAEGLDISYWESVLSQLNAHMARVRLRDRHQSNLRSKLEVLKAEQGMATAEVPSSPQSPVPPPKQDQDSPVVIKTEEEERPEDGPEAVLEEDGAEDQTEESNRGDIMIEQSLNDYEAGRYSPKYVPPSEMEANAVVLTEDEDFKRMEFLRAQVMFPGVHGASSSAAKVPMTSEEKVFQKEAKKGMTDEEAQFSVEAALEQKVYLWSDKYRPRKPRYFNRVHTGFEWNKYNQTHYDMDNPPPKIVQGYKFNIFYPDLIDKNSTPEYCLIPCSDNRDFSILKFHAGPPYEDIAFKIVNREWEYSYKRGFRCQFQNNIFQLWFHFKRYRYRR